MQYFINIVLHIYYFNLMYFNIFNIFQIKT